MDKYKKYMSKLQINYDNEIYSQKLFIKLYCIISTAFRTFYV
jgi:hypothetical protein